MDAGRLTPVETHKQYTPKRDDLYFPFGEKQFNERNLLWIAGSKPEKGR